MSGNNVDSFKEDLDGGDMELELSSEMYESDGFASVSSLLKGSMDSLDAVLFSSEDEHKSKKEVKA